MKRAQIDTMLTAARELVRLADQADPLAVQWANDILAIHTARGYRQRSSPAADRLMALWNDDPRAGFTLAELRNRLGTVNASFQHLLRAQCRSGKLHPAGPHGHTRYFADPDACAEAAEGFRQQADAARVKALEPKPLKIPRLASTPRPRVATPFNDRLAGEPRPKKPSLPPRPELVRVPGPVSMFDRGEAFRPDHVQVQVIPTKPDPRYHVEAPATGFLSEWKKLRGEA